MARPILLVTCGILLCCQALSTSATSGRDDDGTSNDGPQSRPLTTFGTEGIEQEAERVARSVDHSLSLTHQAGPQYGSNPSFYPSGGIGYQPAQSYPAIDTLHQTATHDQPQPETYPAYQPTHSVEPQHGGYPYYQSQPQYPVYPPAPAVQPPPSTYTVYQPAPAAQPQYIYEPAPAAEPQVVYQPAPAAQPQVVYQPAPAAAPQAVYQPAPAPVAQPQHHSYPSQVIPGQSYKVVKYIPGVVRRRYQCRQRVECGWSTETQPGRYIYIIKYYPPTPIIPRPPVPGPNIIYVCPRQQCPTVRPQQCINPGISVVPPVVPPTPTYNTCVGHQNCVPGQYCCYGGYNSASLQCQPGTAVPLRTTRHLQLNNTAASRTHVDLVIGQWRNTNVTAFVTDLLLPLKVDLETDMEVVLRTDPGQEQNTLPCDNQDTDCIGPRILSCVAQMLPPVIQPFTYRDSIPHTASFLQPPPSGPMGNDLEPRLVGPFINTTDMLDEDYWRSYPLTSSSGDPVEVEEVDPVASAVNGRQVQLLSFAACLLQSFGAGVVERKKSALLAAKRCVRAYKLEWPRVRACAAPRGHGAGGGGGRMGPLHRRPLEITVNGEPAPELDNMKLALCQALLRAGQAPLLCDLLYDQLDQSEEEQGFGNTRETVGILSYEGDTNEFPVDSHSNEGGDIGGSIDSFSDNQRPPGGWGEQDWRSWDTLPSHQPQEEADIRGGQGANLNLRDSQWEPEGWEEESVGFSINRMNQNLEDLPVAAPLWNGGRGDPYEV